MTTEGRSQRPGTNASREGSQLRSALDINKEQSRASFIQFGRAEQAAKEAQERAIERIQSEQLAPAVGETVSRASGAVPMASAIPNSGRQLTASGGSASYGAQGSSRRAAASSYRTPYAYGSTAHAPLSKSLAANSTSPHRSQSTSASLREKEARRQRQRPAAHTRPRLFPLMFFCTCLAVIGLIALVAHIISIEGNIREQLSIGGEAAQSYIRTQPTLADYPVTPGMAWRAFRTYLIFITTGMLSSIFAWKTAKPFWTALAGILYSCAIIRMPDMWMFAVSALAIAALSIYILISGGRRRVAGGASLSRGR